jgi:hypothetical protein
MSDDYYISSLSPESYMIVDVMGRSSDLLRCLTPSHPNCNGAVAVVLNNVDRSLQLRG